MLGRIYSTSLTRNDGDVPSGSGSEPELQRMAADAVRICREWLSLRDLTYYANVSERTIRSWIHSPVDPLPAVKVSGKVLVRKSDFDAKLQRHSMKPLEKINLDAIVKDVVKGVGNGR